MQLNESEFIRLVLDSPYDSSIRSLQRCLDEFMGDTYAVLGLQLLSQEMPTTSLRRVDKNSLSKEGRKYFDRFKVEIGKVVCGKEYQTDREKLKALIVSLMPTLLARLELPVEAAGIAAVCLIIVFKMGTQTFCASLGIELPKK